MANRVLIVGWDGADWEILDPLLAAGDLPNLAGLIARGQRGVSRSCLPSHSWAAWPTFLTGRDPAGHAVFDILEYRPGASRRLPVSYRSILAPTWPQRLSDAGKATLLVNVPLTYPPPQITGVVIAGGVIPQGSTYSHPPEAGPRLDWPINGGSWTTFRHRPLDLIADVERVTADRAEAMRRLMDEQPWDAACMVFVSPDRIQHCLLEYVHPGHPSHRAAAQSPVAERVRDVYRLLDRELGTLLERVDGDDLVMLMSDHGHQPVTRALNMNRVLERLGLLTMGRGSGLVSLLAWGRLRSIARRVYDRLGLHGRVAVPTPPVDWSRSRAYTSVTSTGEGVSIALRGREPEGTVEPADYERVRDEVAAALLGFTDPDTGAHPIGRVMRKEEVLSGPHLDRAPDLLLEAAPLYSLTHARKICEPADWLSGDHRREGVYVAAGPGIEPGAGPEISLADFAAAIATAVGLPDGDEDDDRPVVAGVPQPCSAPTRSARSRSGCAGWDTSSSDRRQAGDGRAMGNTQPMSDERTLLSGTALNVVGLGAGVVAAFGVQVLIGRHLGREGLGLVTVAVQVAFVAAAGSRFGMDLSAVRDVAVARGAGSADTVRSLVERCTALAAAVSLLAAAAIAAVAGVTGHREIAIAAASIPFAAATNVYLGATRGIKSMAPTLWVFWIGQPLAWIALAAVAFAAGGSADAAVWCYDASWLIGLAAARWLWRRASRGFGNAAATPEQLRAALRFGLPRAPSALLAQALFWADLWVVGGYVDGAHLGTYAAVGRVSQVLLLFLTSVNLLFSPFAADLHARGQRDRLDALFKSATRWALAATLPVVIVLFVAAADVLAAFGPRYAGGEDALRILLAGQLVNVATGSVAFVLIMVGRTRLDLLDNLLAVALLVGLAAPLSSAYGIEGAAISSAIALSAVNLLRLGQVARLVGIQPYTGAYLRLALPAAACGLAAVAAHAAAGAAPWYAALLATAVAATAAYLVLLPSALPAGERQALYRVTRRIANRGPR